MDRPHIEKSIRWAGRLIAAGLAVQLLSLTRLHPLAFVAFLAGIPLVAAGVVLYLIGLVRHNP